MLQKTEGRERKREIDRERKRDGMGGRAGGRERIGCRGRRRPRARIRLVKVRPLTGS